MIPSVVASEVTGALRDFLTTGFGPSSPELSSVVDDFLAEERRQPERLQPQVQRLGAHGATSSPASSVS